MKKYSSAGNFSVGNKPKKMYKSLKGHRNETHMGWRAIKFLPNVKKFKVMISGYDTALAIMGIKKRNPPKIKLEPHKNRKYNRYIAHQFRRIENCSKTNSKLAWRIGMHLIKRSNIFLVMALNHVFPKWHREMKLSSVIGLAIETRRIATDLESKLDYKRTYIPKSNGKVRPLGVPTPAWRIYLHMVNVVLTFILESSNKMHESQHGFRPGRGTLSAWKVILKEVIESKDIFEFDLKSFFDKVNLDYISKQLVNKGVPVEIVRRIYYINTAACTVKPPYKLNEFEHKMKELIHIGANMKDIVEAPRPLSYMYRVRGVPQGSPTSPVLAALALENSILDRGVKEIMYADDGLYYGDINQPLITPNSGMTEANIYFNLDKTGWVKKDGEWIKPLKFLGMEYDGVNDELRANTRNGSKLIADKNLSYKTVEIMECMSYDGELKVGRYNRVNWEEFVNSKLIGFIQSRLYQGSWKMEGYEQSFELSRSEGSFVDLKEFKQKAIMNVFNSTSFSSEWLVKKLKQIKKMRLL